MDEVPNLYNLLILQQVILSEIDHLADVRDGLKRKERIVLYCLDQAQKELGGRDVPTAMLYGRVVEYVNISEDELQAILQRLSNYNRGSEG